MRGVKAELKQLPGVALLQKLHRQIFREIKTLYRVPELSHTSYVLALFLLVVAVVLAEEKYTTKYDNIDLDTILTSDRLLKNYVNCLLDKGSCTPDGKELKEVLPDALMTECHKCSEKQKKGTEKVVRYLVNKKPETWEQLKKKYDPTGKYSIKYTDEAHKQGINV
ncbi:PEB3 protein, partial [Acromyrmex charruanus]